jgi:hypothetical protein
MIWPGPLLLGHTQHSCFTQVMLFIEAIEAHHKSPMLGLQARDLFEYYTKEKSSEKWTSDREFH